MRFPVGLKRLLGHQPAAPPAAPAAAGSTCSACGSGVTEPRRYGLTLETTQGVASGLQRLVDTGLFGQTPSEAAERIIAHHLDDRTR
jgi:hypothetical protein